MVARFRRRCSHKFHSLTSILLDRYSLRSSSCHQLSSCKLSSLHKYRYRSRDHNSSRDRLRSCKLSSRRKFLHNSRGPSSSKGQGSSCKSYNQRCSQLHSRGPGSSRGRKCRCTSCNQLLCLLDSKDHCRDRKQQAMFLKDSCSLLDFSMSRQDTDPMCR